VASDEHIEAYLPLARKQAGHATWLWEQNFDEAYSDALFGLAWAWTHRRVGWPFEPYANRCIRGSILHGIRDRSSRRPQGRHGMPDAGGGGSQFRPHYHFVSFDEPESEHRPALAEMIAGEPVVETQELWATVARTLAPREHLIVGLYYRWGLSQETIGGLVGLSQMQISRLLRRSLRQLRDVLA